MPTNVEQMSTLGQEHDRAEQRLRAALVEQHRSHERYDAAVGGSAGSLLGERNSVRNPHQYDGSGRVGTRG